MRLPLAHVGLAHEPQPRLHPGDDRDRLIGVIGGTVINDDHPQIGVIRGKDRVEAAKDRVFLVIGRDQDGDRRGGGIAFGELVRPAHMGERNHRQRPRQTHQHDHPERRHDPAAGQAEQPERNLVKRLARADGGRHDLVATDAQHLGQADDAVAVRAQPVDQRAERVDGSLPVAATIVQHDDVAAAGRQAVDHVVDDLAGVEVKPVGRHDVAANHQVAGLRKNPHRARRLAGDRPFAAPERGAEQNGRVPGEHRQKPLCGVQLQPGAGVGNAFEFGMQKGVGTDLMAVGDHAPDKVGIGERARPDEKERRRRVARGEHVEHVAREARIGAIIESDGHGIGGRGAEPLDPPWHGQGIEARRGDPVLRGVKLDEPPARYRLRDEAVKRPGTFVADESRKIDPGDELRGKLAVHVARGQERP